MWSSDRVSIRNAEAADIDRIMEIAEPLGLSTRTKSDYLSDLASEFQLMLVSLVNNRIVGFLSGRSLPMYDGNDRAEAEIHNIGVEPEYQRKGIATELIHAFGDRISRLGSLSSIWIEVRAGNRAAIQFYEKLGFCETARRRGYYTEPRDDAIVMALTSTFDDG